MIRYMLHEPPPALSRPSFFVQFASAALGAVRGWRLVVLLVRYLGRLWFMLCCFESADPDEGQHCKIGRDVGFSDSISQAERLSHSGGLVPS